MKRFLILIFLPLWLQGCASYYSHSAVFQAENSRGEPRQVRLTWETAEYPGWWPVSDKATPISVETQCSERIWRLRDSSQDGEGSCGEGIRACGDPKRDISFPGASPVGPSTVCLAAYPSGSGKRIADIDGRLELAVSCQPARVSEGEGDNIRNLDYLRASPVPYMVYTRKAPRGAFRARIPEFQESICDGN
ncbi:hypothetical protein FWJ25_10555 [Marinobacter salinexigens]|uniref:Lipoprotein n=1 Tax=Marinobacter salinexigens TaxID=2919747 RepID=A0A5B0VGW6_9GAMM|nr:hypothetical protein FWJ25_10555 [Marinobacter salinexigens]